MEKVLKSLFIEYLGRIGNIFYFESFISKGVEVDWGDPGFYVSKTYDGYICDFSSAMGKLLLFGQRTPLHLSEKGEKCPQAFQSICDLWPERKKIMNVLKEKDCLCSVNKIHINGNICVVGICYSYFYCLPQVFKKLIKLDVSKVYYNEDFDRFEWEIEMNTEDFINMIKLIAD